MNAVELLKGAKSIIAISNYKASRSIENLSARYDCIVRFNSGANPLEVSRRNLFYNLRTDVAVLSGWAKGEYGSLRGFKNIPILFSRPKDKGDGSQTLKPHSEFFVKDLFLSRFKRKDFSFVPYGVYCDFVSEFNYLHPSSGLLTLFYIKRYLNKNFEVINFFIDSKMHNTFLNLPSVNHSFNYEKMIFNKLKLVNHIFR